MIGRSGIMGTLGLSRHGGHAPYNQADQSFLMDIAFRTALAVENIRLFDSLRSEISEREAAHEALDISERRFRAIFQATALGIKVLDLDGNILQTNLAYDNMIGHEQGELFGRHFADFIHPDDRRRALELFHDIKMSGAFYTRFEHRGLHRDGSAVWMKTIFTSVRHAGDDRSRDFVVGIIENISDQKRIAQEMEELNNRLQGSLEMERLRLAQELHDNPMQTLYAAIYQIEELRNTVDPKAKAALQNVNNDIKSVLDGLRATAKELRPPTLFSFGLEHAIRSHVDDIRDRYPNIKVSLSLAHDRQLLPERARLALFRVTQQSLSNVLRHAEATEIKVRFSFDAEEVRLEVSDNGKGFEVPRNWIQLVRNGHYGLAGASERIQALGGSLNVKSQPGSSTVVTVVIPWKKLQD
jgi:PAS domain S-box-containing protein